MKKFCMAAVMFFCCIFFAACGKEELETEVFYDIETEAEELDFPGESGDVFLSMQFWQDEPVLLVMRMSDGFKQNIYLCKADGSRELLVKGANESGREFLCFLLGEEAQSVCVDKNSAYHHPVLRSAFQIWVDVQREKVADGNFLKWNYEKWNKGEWVREFWLIGEEKLEDERIEEYLATLEDARELPYHTTPIIELICEEATSYFAGSKSIDEVRSSTQNRVQLYLNEREGMAASE